MRPAATKVKQKMRFDRSVFADFRRRYKDTIVGQLGIVLKVAREKMLVAEMPVDARHRNSQNYLHGRVSLLLAETMGSFASLCVVKGEKKVVGMCVSANHISSVEANGRDRLRAVTRPLHLGGRSHVWSTTIRNTAKKVVCVMQLTVSVFDKETEKAHSAPARPRKPR